MGLSCDPMTYGTLAPQWLLANQIRNMPPSWSGDRKRGPHPQITESGCMMRQSICFTVVEQSIRKSSIQSIFYYDVLNTLDLTKKGLEFLFFSEQRVQLHHCICFAAKLLKADVCSAFYRDYGIRGTQHANWNIWEVFNLLALRDTEGKLYSACPNTRH